MAKRRYGIDEDKIARFLKDGRGQGKGGEYRPWLTIQDVPSSGRCSRIRGRKTGREHHLLSDIETSAFLLYDWSDAITDIREQYPLDREQTRRIAAEMGVRHPLDAMSQTDIVMTTDFVLDVVGKNGGKMIARSVKPSERLDDGRTLEKLEIERRCWAEKGADWGLVTERELPAQRVKNLRWLHEMASLEHLVAPYVGYWEDRCERFMAAICQAGGVTIRRFAQQLESTQGFATGECLTVLRHLAAIRRLEFNLDARFDMSAPIDAFRVVAPPNSNRDRKTA